MYLIDPITVTAKNGVLVSSTVAYPDHGVNTLGQPLQRWVQYRAYAAGTRVMHYGVLWLAMVDVPAAPVASVTSQLPPGHIDGGLTWQRLYPPLVFDPSVAYASGALVAFPAVSYGTTLASTNPMLSNAERFSLASTPTFTPPGYPSGMWRRNSTPDSGESLLPKYPSLASPYWDAMEPPLFDEHPEVPVGELTTFGGRVWRKRVATMAAFEAPPSAPLDWALQKTSNRYAMFDVSVQSQTRQTRGSHSNPVNPADDEIIEVVLQAPADRVVDALALLNVAATSVRVQVASSGGAPVYDRTVPMSTTAMIPSNWYDWFFAPRYLQRTALFDDLPATLGARVTVTITNAGGQAACGACIVGKRVELGMTLTGVTLGIKDYSVKTEDDFGNLTVTKRAYSDRASLPVLVPNDLIEPLKQTMADFRARPALWVGAPGLPSTVIYGYYKSFSVTVPYPTQSTYTLDIEGLT